MRRKVFLALAVMFVLGLGFAPITGIGPAVSADSALEFFADDGNGYGGGG